LFIVEAGMKQIFTRLLLTLPVVWLVNPRMRA
jgi:hypothetical protein